MVNSVRRIAVYQTRKAKSRVSSKPCNHATVFTMEKCIGNSSGPFLGDHVIVGWVCDITKLKSITMLALEAMRRYLSVFAIRLLHPPSSYTHTRSYIR